jgi:hypothetical protein
MKTAAAILSQWRHQDPDRLLQTALRQAEQKAQCDPQSFSALRQALERKALLLLEAPRSEPCEEAVRNRLNKQRDHLFTFLDHDGVDATNNLAERQLRPAVIARKISCGNKTQKGARADSEVSKGNFGIWVLKTGRSHR